MRSLHTSVFLLSVALIALQIILMHVLSIVQWHHFAALIISVALLGFGTAGTVIALFRELLLRKGKVVIPLSMFLSGITMSFALFLSQRGPARFDTYLVFVEQTHRLALLLSCGIFLVPFFFGALALGLVFVRDVSRIGSLYAANLAGSGLGGLFAVAMLWLLSPQQAIQLTALVAILSGVIMTPSSRIAMRVLAGAAGGVVCVALFFSADPLVLSEYKSLSRSLTLPDAKVIAQRDSPEGRIQVVASQALRYAPGLSLTYAGDIPVREAVFLNGNWFGPVISGHSAEGGHLLDYTTDALPYVLGHRNRVVVLAAGTGLNVAQALSNAANVVDAVEQNGTAVKVMLEDLPSSEDSPFLQHGVSLHTVEPRTFLMSDSSRYDLIVLPMLESFGGTSGLYAMQETFVLTQEAFAGMWQRLSPSGVVSASAWVDNPVRTPLKLLATIVTMVREGGIREVESHIVAVRSWGTITITAKRTPFDPIEVDRVREFCGRMKFDPLLLPGIVSSERERYNRLPGTTLLSAVDSVLHGGLRFEHTYPFDILPATDDRPFFFQFLRFEDLFALYTQFGSDHFPFLELGYFMVVLTLVQLIVLAIVLIVLPLFRIRWKGGGALWSLLYFAALGLGYMFMEIVFIRHFTLYLGHPIVAAAVVLSGMLGCSGAGSYVSRRLSSISAGMRTVTAGIVLMTVLYLFVLAGFVDLTISLPLVLKILLTLMFISPAAVLMGMPFPLGLRRLSVQNETLVPWAWGINGCFSVISAVLAAFLAVELGFSVVMICAGAAYVIALAAGGRVKAVR